MGWKKEVGKWISDAYGALAGETTRIESHACAMRRRLGDKIESLEKEVEAMDSQLQTTWKLSERRGIHIEANIVTLGEFRKRIKTLEAQAQEARYEALPEFASEHECPLCEGMVAENKRSGFFDLDYGCNGMPIVIHTCRCGWSVVTKALEGE